VEEIPIVFLTHAADVLPRTLGKS